MKHTKTKHKTSPHDSFIIDLFSNKRNVQTFMRHYLPADLLKEISIDKITIDTSQYVSGRLKKYSSDVVICTELRKNGPGKTTGKSLPVDIYILFEHKSYHDDKVLLQLLKYMYLMYQKDADEGKQQRIIIPFIFYHGKKEWHIAPCFADQFEVSDTLKKYMLNFRYILFDTHRWDFDKEKKMEISKNINLFTSLMLVKSVHDNNLQFLSKVIDFIIKNDFIVRENIHTNNRFMMILEYISQTRDISLEDLADIFSQTEIEGNNIMTTLAQRLEKIGMQKGIQQGKQEGKQEGHQEEKIEVARKMLSLNYSVNDICAVTGLSENEVTQLGTG